MQSLPATPIPHCSSHFSAPYYSLCLWIGSLCFPRGMSAQDCAALTQHTTTMGTFSGGNLRVCWHWCFLPCRLLPQHIACPLSQSPGVTEQIYGLRNVMRICVMGWRKWQLQSSMCHWDSRGFSQDNIAAQLLSQILSLCFHLPWTSTNWEFHFSFEVTKVSKEMRGDHSVFSLTFPTGEELLEDSATNSSSHCYLTPLHENTRWKAVKT